MLNIAKQSLIALMLIISSDAKRHLDDNHGNRHLVLANPN
jgi:hypothetical protein